MSIINGPSTLSSVTRRTILNIAFVAALAFLIELQRGSGLSEAAIAAGIIGLTPLVPRALIEGGADMSRNGDGVQLPGDVGQPDR